VIMNTAVEDVIAFKCCSLPDQNLEIQVRNTGNRPVMVPGYFKLDAKSGESLRIDHAYPPWGQTLEPGDSVAFYCSMDERVWEKYRTLTIFDGDGNGYSVPIRAE